MLIEYAIIVDNSDNVAMVKKPAYDVPIIRDLPESLHTPPPEYIPCTNKTLCLYLLCAFV